MASIPTDQQIHLVLDFDGTITVEDTGDDLFKTFGEFEPVHSLLLAGQITVAEYYQRSAALLRRDLTPDALTRFAVERDVDPGLSGLIDLCHANNVHVVVASDGFDGYIVPILANQGLQNVEVHCNTLAFRDGSWQVGFPGATESCSCFCASCKRNAVLQHVAEKDLVIYVGDGRSDTCAARHADVIFAKHYLARWCTDERIPHHPFKTLHDVRRVLAGKLASGSLRSRRQATLARNAAFEAE